MQLGSGRIFGRLSQHQVWSVKECHNTSTNRTNVLETLSLQYLLRRLLLVNLVGCWGVENYPNPSDVDLTRSRLLVGRGAQEQF
jgi:hypothetical protein